MDTSPIKLIVGLGNPGEKYIKTRHNAGFLFLHKLCEQNGVSLKSEKHCLGKTAQISIAGQSVRLLAPDTFMNLSGNALVATLNYYKLDLSEALVVHDELDLDPGVARLKVGGGHGGNNGLRDIIGKASKDFLRLRIGIGHPGVGRDVSNYVLGTFNNADQQAIKQAIDDALFVLPDVIAGDVSRAMNELHTAK